MELIALLGADKEAWGQFTALYNHGEWEKIVLIKTEGAEAYPTPENVHEVTIKASKPLVELKKEFVEKLKPVLSEFDAHLSIASGSGKEHMALIAALLAIPVGIRLVAFTKNGVEVIN